MPYVNLVGQSVAGKEAIFQHIRDFLCKRNGTFDHSADGVGWTLHDSSYAVDEDNISSADYFVVYSPGESGDDDLYYKFTYLATDYIECVGYLYWDNVGHTGVNAYGASNTFSVLTATSGSLYIYANLDDFKIFRNQSSISKPLVSGKLDTYLDTTVGTNPSGGATAGTDVVLTVDAVPAGIEVDKKFVIRDNADLEIATCTAKTATTVTATITNSYSAGFKISRDLGYYAQGDSGPVNLYMMMSRSGASGLTQKAYSSVPVNADPDGYDSDRVIESIALTYGGAYYGEMQDIYTMSNTGMTDLAVISDKDGNDYRFFDCSSFGVAVLEV